MRQGRGVVTSFEPAGSLPVLSPSLPAATTPLPGVEPVISPKADAALMDVFQTSEGLNTENNSHLLQMLIKNNILDGERQAFADLRVEALVPLSEEALREGEAAREASLGTLRGSVSHEEAGALHRNAAALHREVAILLQSRLPMIPEVGHEPALQLIIEHGIFAEHHAFMDRQHRDCASRAFHPVAQPLSRQRVG